MAPSKGSAAIDTVPLPEKPVVGKIVKARGKYFLQVKARRIEIPLNPLTTEKQVAQFAGKDVNVALSGQDNRSVLVVGTWPTQAQPQWRRRLILCYLPAPDLRGEMNEKLQEIILEQLAR